MTVGLHTGIYLNENIKNYLDKNSVSKLDIFIFHVEIFFGSIGTFKGLVFKHEKTHFLDPSKQFGLW